MRLNSTVSRTSLREQTAEEIRALLARRQMSATKLAERLGMTQPYLARRMRGAQPFNVDELAAIAALLEVPVITLLGDAARQVSPGAGLDTLRYARLTDRTRPASRTDEPKRSPTRPQSPTPLSQRRAARIGSYLRPVAA